jgi:hypothetical protein
MKNYFSMNGHLLVSTNLKFGYCFCRNQLLSENFLLYKIKIRAVIKYLYSNSFFTVVFLNVFTYQRY